MTDFNLQSLRTRQFKGFVQFQDPGGATYYRLKERQTMTVNFNFSREAHYSDDGVKVLDPAGHNHTFSLTLKNTSDLYDPSFSNTSASNTLSYWIYKMNAVGSNIADLDPVEVIFVSTQEALSGPAGSTTEKFIHWKFTLDPQTLSTGFGATGGTNEINIGGEVISIESVIRSSSATPP